MNLTTTDAKIIIIYAVVMVIASFLFPALGMAGSEQTQSDIPDFNISETRFDFVGDLPQIPGAPSSGVLNGSSNKFDDFRGSPQNEIGNDVDGNRTFLVANTTGWVWIADVTNGSVHSETEFTSDGQIETLQANNFTIDVHAADLNGNFYEYKITDRPEDQTFLGSIPIVGGIFSSNAPLPAIVGWIGATIFAAVIIVIEGAANVGGIMFDVLSFFIDLMQWLIGTWSPIMNGAPGYAKVILTVLAVPLWYVFGKVGVILVNMVNPFG